MILSYNAAQETDSSSVNISSWIAKLQEGKKSTQQIQSEMLDGVTKVIEEVQEKAAEKAEEEKQEGKNQEAVTVSVHGSGIESSSDVPETTETTTVEIQA